MTTSYVFFSAEGEEIVELENAKSKGKVLRILNFNQVAGGPVLANFLATDYPEKEWYCSFCGKQENLVL